MRDFQEHATCPSGTSRAGRFSRLTYAASPPAPPPGALRAIASRPPGGGRLLEHRIEERRLGRSTRRYRCSSDPRRSHGRPRACRPAGASSRLGPYSPSQKLSITTLTPVLRSSFKSPGDFSGSIMSVLSVRSSSILQGSRPTAFTTELMRLTMTDARTVLGAGRSRARPVHAARRHAQTMATTAPRSKSSPAYRSIPGPTVTTSLSAAQSAGRAAAAPSRRSR